MMDAVERVVRGASEPGALCATGPAASFYAARRQKVWEGPSPALTPSGIKRTAEDDGGVYVLARGDVPLDLSGDISCGWRDGDVW